MVDEVEGTMKETLESMDKLQAKLDQVNVAKAFLEAKANTAKDQVVDLQQQIQVLQAQTIESLVFVDKVIKLDNELKKAVAWRGSLYMEAQNAVKKELTARFPREYFSWIHNILLKDEDEEEDVNNPENLYVTENNVIDVEDPISETWEEGTEDPPAQWFVYKLF